MMRIVSHKGLLHYFVVAFIILSVAMGCSKSNVLDDTDIDSSIELLNDEVVLQGSKYGVDISGSLNTKVAEGDVRITSIHKTSDVVTKGIITTAPVQMADIYVATYTATPAVYATGIYEQAGSYFSATMWRGNPPLTWPKDEQTLSFLSFSPAPSASNGVTVSSVGEQTLSIQYKMPLLAINQPDLLLADRVLNIDGETIDAVVNSRDVKNVELNFTSAFAALGFEVKNRVGVNSAVKSITIKGIRDIGTTTMSLASGAASPVWSLNNVTETVYSAGLLTKEEQTNARTVHQFQYEEELMRPDGYLMLLPQTITDAASITVIMETGESITFKMSDFHISELQAGFKYIFMLDVPMTKPDVSVDQMVHPTESYVGAFWRAEEFGERVIRIPHEAGEPWTVYLTWLDDKWAGPSHIVLSPWTGSPYDLDGIGLRGALSGDPEEVTVPGLNNRISGVGDIMFRIALGSKYIPADGEPRARYAILLIQHSNGIQRFFIRQGGEPQYLAGSEYETISVYNLTGKLLYNGQQHEITAAPLTGTKDAIFVDYPTQAGAMWRSGIVSMEPLWSLNDTFHPAGSYPGSQWHYDPTGLTFTIGDDLAPTGYTKPDKARFSLLLANNIPLFGYYADGFFDRGDIIDGAVWTPRPLDPTYEKNDIAYRGVLLVSTANMSSIFLPASGYMDLDVNSPTKGGVVGAGSIGYFQSTNPNESFVFSAEGISFEKMLFPHSIRPVLDL